MNRRSGLTRTLRTLVAIPLLLAAHVVVLSPSASAGPAQVGEWTPPFRLGVIGIHTTLLHTGKVLLFDFASEPGTRAKLWDPVTEEVADVSLAWKRDMFCSGHDVLPDGRVFVTGGNRWNAKGFDGSRRTDLFDPVTQTWTTGPKMDYARWYPTNVELPNGDVLIFSGQESDERTVRRVERFDPEAGVITQLPWTASKRMDLYPRIFLLPNGKLFWAGEKAGTRLFDPSTNEWSFVGYMNQGGRYAGNAVLLPGLERVLTMGGHAERGATDAAEIIDFADPAPAWREVSPMIHARQHSNAVLLPDGTVLVVGGGEHGEFEDPVMQAELFDPEAETWTGLASQTAGRMYHSTAVLLPDGRVLSAGQNDGRFEKAGEIYSPPYLFKGPRPVIASTPAAISYGQGFSISTPDAGNVERVALIRPGSATHGVNFEQRYVDLAFSAGADTLSASAPADGAEAPPGWYMLFIVNAKGVPSVAAWVHVA